MDTNNSIIAWSIESKLTEQHGQNLIDNGIECYPSDLLDTFFLDNGNVNEQSVTKFVNKDAKLWNLKYEQQLIRGLKKLYLQQNGNNLPNVVPNGNTLSSPNSNTSLTTNELSVCEKLSEINNCGFDHDVANNYANILAANVSNAIDIMQQGAVLLQQIGIESTEDSSKIACAVAKNNPAVINNSVGSKLENVKPLNCSPMQQVSGHRRQTNTTQYVNTNIQQSEVKRRTLPPTQQQVPGIVQSIPALVNSTTTSITIYCNFGHLQKKNFTVYYMSQGEQTWKQATADCQENHFTVTDLIQNTEYRFKIALLDENGTPAFISAVSDYMFTRERYASRVARQSEPSERGCPSIYRLASREVYVDEANFLRVVHVGQETDVSKENKIIMVIGETGSGKSTLINAMTNYVMGVDYEDNFRFKLIYDMNERREQSQKSQAHSQTKYITAYKLHWNPESPVNYSLTIVDTPGYGDTEGLERDELLTKQIEHFYKSNKIHEIQHVDAIGFVMNSSHPRLTPMQKYIFDRVLSIFGRDIEKNIFLMLTFADASPATVLTSVEEFGIKYNKPFKFNNSAVYAPTNGPDVEFVKLFWKMGIKSFEDFFQELRCMQSRSLLLSKVVLEERSHLQAQVQGLMQEINHGLSVLEQVDQEIAAIQRYETEINAHRNFVITVKVPRVKKVSIAGTGEYVTNCTRCNFTCHPSCAYKNDGDKHKCSAMNRAKDPEKVFCEVCPKKCHWKDHVNNDFRWENYEEYQTQTLEELKKKYDSAMEGKTKSQAMKESAQSMYDQIMRDKVMIRLQSAQKCIKRLDEIALRPSDLSTVDYIDILIEAEKRQKKTGYLERITHLENAKQLADCIRKIKRGELLKNYQEKTNPNGQGNMEYSPNNVKDAEPSGQDENTWENAAQKGRRWYDPRKYMNK